MAHDLRCFSEETVLTATACSPCAIVPQSETLVTKLHMALAHSRRQFDAIEARLSGLSAPFVCQDRVQEPTDDADEQGTQECRPEAADREPWNEPGRDGK